MRLLSNIYLRVSIGWAILCKMVLSAFILANKVLRYLKKNLHSLAQGCISFFKRTEVEIEEIEYTFRQEERPSFPGSPFSPAHPLKHRLGYAAIALLVATTASLGNALVTVNINNLSGALGVYLAQATLLIPIYVGMNASANLLLIKARMRFGIPAVTHTLLAAYAVAAAFQIIFPGYASAVIIRAVNGVAAAALTTLTIYNLLQVFPVKQRPLALLLGISVPQLASPVARLFPVEMLALQSWQGLHLIELGLALSTLAAIKALPLPPSEISYPFEPLDFLSIALLAPALMLLCCVLGVGRVVWWTDTPWLGWALVAATLLFASGLLIEYYRKSPLLQIRWIATGDILRFAVVALMVRVALAEQTYGSVGLLTFGGLNNDQLHTLFLFVILGMVLGIVAAIVTLNPSRLAAQVMVASFVIAIGAWMDSFATDLTRPNELYLSQALIAFGTTLFIGPSILYGFLRMMAKGPNYLISFIVIFSVSQNIGGLAGSAWLGTYQVERTRAHAAALSEHVIAADPQVVTRLQTGTIAISGALTDPGLKTAEGAALLGQSLNREANILAFNDVFRLVSLLALSIGLFLLYRVITLKLRTPIPVLSEAAK